MKLYRIDALLSSRGYCSRRECPGYMRRNQILVDGQQVFKGEQKVDPLSVEVNGQPLDPEQLYIIMNKPAGYTCSHDDRGQLIYDLLPQRYRERSPLLATIGRLDKETTGIILLSDDGQLNHRLTSPKKKVPKRYLVSLAQPVSPEDIAQIEEGSITLAGENHPLMPAKVQILDSLTLELTIWEGRYHQIRRTFEHLNNYVEALHRISFADLTVADLSSGEYRSLTPAEMTTLQIYPKSKS